MGGRRKRPAPTLLARGGTKAAGRGRGADRGTHTAGWEGQETYQAVGSGHRLPRPVQHILGTETRQSTGAGRVRRSAQALLELVPLLCTCMFQITKHRFTKESHYGRATRVPNSPRRRDVCRQPVPPPPSSASRGPPYNGHLPPMYWLLTPLHRHVTPYNGYPTPL